MMITVKCPFYLNEIVKVPSLKTIGRIIYISDHHPYCVIRTINKPIVGTVVDIGDLRKLECNKWLELNYGKF